MLALSLDTQELDGLEWVHPQKLDNLKRREIGRIRPGTIHVGDWYLGVLS